MDKASYLRCLVSAGLLLMGALVTGCRTPQAAPVPTVDLVQAATENGPPETPSGPVLERSPFGEAPEHVARRAEMVAEGIAGWGIEDEAVIEAMGRVPRHAFVPAEYLSQAYQNHPLPIGYGQTISQPYIVALMTQAVAVSAGDKVLEIGTGSGYQAAVLAELVGQVYSLEIIEPLAEQAEELLVRLGYDNVTVGHADGYFGWPEEAPFDAIVVTAAPDHIPQPLVEQLKPGGRMVIPVGPVGGFQTLWLVTKGVDGEVTTRDLGGVRFVPLTREMR
jgi:protein-L-isoaspartate(D-aspartate) O-methyltransferase